MSRSLCIVVFLIFLIPGAYIAYGQSFDSSVFVINTQKFESSILVDGFRQNITSKMLVNQEADQSAPPPSSSGSTLGSSYSYSSGGSSSGGGHSSGGGGGRTGVGPSTGGTTTIPQIGEIVLYSASWDCSTGVLKVIAGPDSDLLSLQIRTSTSGVKQVEQSDEILKNRAIFTASIDKNENYVGLKLIATSGRNVGVVSESINISQCTGEKTFNEYVEKQISTSKMNPFDSPLQQVKRGVLPADVKCNDSRQLYIKNSISPVCLYHDSYEKLIEYGLDLQVPKS